MKKLFALFLSAASLALAQQPQTQTAPLFQVNAKYVNGVAPGYAPTAGSGLTLNLSAGTANCGGTMVTYSAGTLSMTASSTNYVYLDATSSCAPGSNTTGFSGSNIPIAKVVTSGSAITAITDDRTMFMEGSASGSPTGSAGGDLSGTYPNPGVAKINGGAVPASQPCLGSNSSSQPIAGTCTVAMSVANAGSTGTTLNKLAKVTGAPSTAVIAATTDTGGVIGIVTAGAGTSGSATIQINGLASCVFSSATTAGHYVQISSSTGGDCADSGATYPTSGQVIGRVLSTNGSAGTYQIDLFPSEVQSPSSSGSPTGSAGGDLSGTYPNPGVAKINGASVPASAPCTGTNSSSQLTSVSCGGVTTIIISNAGTTGTTTSTLTKLTGAPSTAVIAATTDTGGIVGITTSGAGTSGSATIQLSGQVNCVFSNATTAGDYVGISSTTGGDCKDTGSTYPASGQAIGRVLSTNGSAGTYQIDLFPSEIQGGAGGYPAAEVHTASATAELDFTTCITSTHRDYELRFSDLKTTSTGQNMFVQVSSDGGSTYDSTTSHYAVGYTDLGVDETLGLSGNSAAHPAGFFIGGYSVATVGGTMRLFNLPNVAAYKHANGMLSIDDGSGGDSHIYTLGWAYYSTSIAINALRVVSGDFGSGGTLASGTVTCQPLP